MELKKVLEIYDQIILCSVVFPVRNEVVGEMDMTLIGKCVQSDTLNAEQLQKCFRGVF